MALKRVYLDQRDWIALARQYYGRSEDNSLAGVLAMVQEASAGGHASFPLSASHYYETYRNGDPGRRRRLGAFMAEISQFHTIAGCVDLLDSEIHVALSLVAGVEPMLRPRPFGRGARHAFGGELPPYFDGRELEQQVISTVGAERVFEYFEMTLIMGPEERLPVHGIAQTSREFAERQLAFERETARKLLAWGHSSDRAHRLVLVQETADMMDRVNEIAADVGINFASIVNSREAIAAFTLSMPAKGVICRLRMSAHENKTFRWQQGDLDDITALGTAAAYCDVVVAENQWGDVLRRHAPHFKARVTSKLLDLPELLLN